MVLRTLDLELSVIPLEMVVEVAQEMVVEVAPEMVVEVAPEMVVEVAQVVVMVDFLSFFWMVHQTSVPSVKEEKSMNNFSFQFSNTT
jgi:hypothetical protein